MGVDTRLLLNSKWELEEIQQVLKSYQNIKSTIRASKVCTRYLILDCDNARSINCHFHYSSPLGNCTLLSFRSNTEGYNMLKSIAKILGGWVNKADTNENYESFVGMFNEENGLPYHYQYAVLHNQLSNDADLPGLQGSIEKWHQDIKKRV